MIEMVPMHFGSILKTSCSVTSWFLLSCSLSQMESKLPPFSYHKAHNILPIMFRCLFQVFCGHKKNCILWNLGSIKMQSSFKLIRPSSLVNSYFHMGMHTMHMLCSHIMLVKITTMNEIKINKLQISIVLKLGFNSGTVTSKEGVMNPLHLEICKINK